MPWRAGAEAEVATAVVVAAAIWEVASSAVVAIWVAAWGAVMSAADLKARKSAADLEAWAAPARLPPVIAVAGYAAATTAAPISGVTLGPATNDTLTAGVVRADFTTTPMTTAASTTRPITGEIHGTVIGETCSGGTNDHSLMVRQNLLQTAPAESGIQASDISSKCSSHRGESSLDPTQEEIMSPISKLISWRTVVAAGAGSLLTTAAAAASAQGENSGSIRECQCLHAAPRLRWSARNHRVGLLSRVRDITVA
jgi:hypothetical protein